MNEKDNVTLGLIMTFGSGVKVSDVYHVEIPDSIHISECRHLDPAEKPFVVMTTEHWNSFQKVIDELGVRDEFRKAKGWAASIPLKNIRRLGNSK